MSGRAYAKVTVVLDGRIASKAEGVQSKVLASPTSTTPYPKKVNFVSVNLGFRRKDRGAVPEGEGAEVEGEKDRGWDGAY